ncbi:MAG: hypothetical protein QXL15_00755 [Candidatus Korarchaeota archaeon]
MHFILLLTPLIIWATMPLVLVPALEMVNPFILIWCRLFLAGITFLAIGIMIYKATNCKISNVQKFFTDAAIVGAAVGLSTSTFFVAVKLSGPILTLGTGSVMPVVLIGIIQNNKEPLSYLKATYLLTTFCAAMFFMLSRLGSVVITPLSIFTLSLYIFGSTLFLITTEKKKSKTHSIGVVMLRNGISFLSGALMVLGVAAVYSFIYEDAELIRAITEFQVDKAFPLNYYVILLVILYTLIPYFMYWYSSTIWPPDAMSFSQWASILNLLETAISTLLSRYVLGEEVNEITFLAAVSFLFVTLMLRYFHESRERVHTLLLIGVAPSKHQSVISRLVKMNEFSSVWSISGEEFLVMVKYISDNHHELEKKLGELKSIDGISSIRVLEILSHKKVLGKN